MPLDPLSEQSVGTAGAPHPHSERTNILDNLAADTSGWICTVVTFVKPCVPVGHEPWNATVRFPKDCVNWSLPINEITPSLSIYPPQAAGRSRPLFLFFRLFFLVLIFLYFAKVATLFIQPIRCLVVSCGIILHWFWNTTADDEFFDMKLYSSLSDDLANWAERQPVFFTGSAATHGQHINVSPKGLDAHFAVLGPNQCAYIDRTGSGCETISHAYDNGRLCIMFMSFGPLPRIMRLFCRASVIEWDQPAFPALVRKIAKGKREAFDGARAIILCDIWQAQTSCGYGVPRIKKGLYAPDADDDGAGPRPVDELLREGSDGETLTELAVFEQRPTLDQYSAKKAQSNGTLQYQVMNNTSSIDGLPGLRAARREAGQRLWVGDAKAKIRRIAAEWEAVAVGFMLASILYVLCAFITVH